VGFIVGCARSVWKGRGRAAKGRENGPTPEAFESSSGIFAYRGGQRLELVVWAGAQHRE